MTSWSRKAVERVKEAPKRGRMLQSERLPTQANGNKSDAKAGWSTDMGHLGMSVLCELLPPVLCR